MPANTSPIFVLSANLAEITFVNADGTTPKDLISAGSNGSKVLGISVVSDDTSTVNLQLFVHDGSTAYLVGTVAVATLSGTNGTTAAVELLSQTLMPWLDAEGELFLPTGYKLQAAPLAAVTSAKTVTIVCFAGDY